MNKIYIILIITLILIAGGVIIFFLLNKKKQDIIITGNTYIGTSPSPPSTSPSPPSTSPSPPSHLNYIDSPTSYVLPYDIDDTSEQLIGIITNIGNTDFTNKSDNYKFIISTKGSNCFGKRLDKKNAQSEIVKYCNINFNITKEDNEIYGFGFERKRRLSETEYQIRLFIGQMDESHLRTYLVWNGSSLQTGYLSYTENDVDGPKDLNNYPIDFILEMIGDGKFVIKIKNIINLNEDDNTITISSIDRNKYIGMVAEDIDKCLQNLIIGNDIENTVLEAVSRKEDAIQFNLIKFISSENRNGLIRGYSIFYTPPNPIEKQLIYKVGQITDVLIGVVKDINGQTPTEQNVLLGLRTNRIPYTYGNTHSKAIIKGFNFKILQKIDTNNYRVKFIGNNIENNIDNLVYLTDQLTYVNISTTPDLDDATDWILKIDTDNLFSLKHKKTNKYLSSSLDKELYINSGWFYSSYNESPVALDDENYALKMDILKLYSVKNKSSAFDISGTSILALPS